MSYQLGALERLLAWAEAGGDEAASFNLDKWADRTPECGTTLCLAGQAVVDGGWTVQWNDYGDGTSGASTCTKNDGPSTQIRDAAREELGVSWWEEDVLFGLSDYGKVDRKTEALALLRELVSRARRNLPPMDQMEMSRWREAVTA